MTIVWIPVQVKLSLYKQDEVQVEMIFNGTDSNIMNWFAKERIISSTSDLTPASTSFYFSIIGDPYVTIVLYC